MTMEGRLSIERVSRHFGGLKAVDAVDLVLEPGGIFCIIGPNGAGKSTLLNIICGTVAPSEGTVRFGNHVIVGQPRHRIARMGIARKFQVPTFFGGLTVHENLRVAALGARARAQQAPSMEEVLSLTNLAGLEHTEAELLAHGQKQWLEIAMALVTGPKLLLLDEPAAGMSPDETLRTARLLLSLKGRATVLVIEHDMHFVRELGSHTIVMHQGRIVASGDFADIESNDFVRDIYLGRRQ